MLEIAECVTRSWLATPGSPSVPREAAPLSQHELVSHTGKDTFQFMKCNKTTPLLRGMIWRSRTHSVSFMHRDLQNSWLEMPKSLSPMIALSIRSGGQDHGIFASVDPWKSKPCSRQFQK